MNQGLVVAPQGAPHSINSNSNSAERLARAQLLLADEKYQEAEAELRATVSADPHLAEAHHKLGLIQQDRGDLQNALVSLENANKADLTSVQMQIDLGRLYYRLGRFVESELALRAAVGLSPQHPVALFNLGHTLRRQGKLDEAKACFEQTISLAPHYALAHEGLAYIYRARGERKLAQAEFKKAYSLLEPSTSFPFFDASTVGEKIRAAFGVFGTAVPALKAAYKWFSSGERDDPGFVKYRVLHQITNGKVTDWLNRYVRWKGRKNPQNQTPFVGPTILPGGPNLTLGPIVDELKRSGVYRFQQRLSDELVDRILRAVDLIPSRPYPKPEFGIGKLVYDPRRPLASIHQFDEADLVKLEVLQNFMFDPAMIEIGREYFGVLPRLANVALWYSPTFDDLPSSYGAQMFHVDFSSLQFLKLFVYLTDVTEETGPHSIVPFSHKADEVGRPLRRRGLVRVCDEDIVDAYSDGGIMNIIGPKGTVFVADTRAFHKGTNPISGDRAVLQLVYVNDGFGFSQDPLEPIRPTAASDQAVMRTVPSVFEKFGPALS